MTHGCQNVGLSPKRQDPFAYQIPPHPPALLGFTSLITAIAA